MTDTVAQLRALATDAARGEAERLRAERVQADIRLGHRIGAELVRSIPHMPRETTPGTLLCGIAYFAAHVVATLPPCADHDRVWALLVQIGRKHMAGIKGA